MKLNVPFVLYPLWHSQDLTKVSSPCVGSWHAPCHVGYTGWPHWDFVMTGWPRFTLLDSPCTGSETWKCERSVFLSGQSLEIDMWANEACTLTYCTYYYRVRCPSRDHWIDQFAYLIWDAYCVCVASLPQTIYWLQTLVALNTVVQLAAHRACPWPGITNDAFRSSLMMMSVYGPGPSIHSHMFDYFIQLMPRVQISKLWFKSHMCIFLCLLVIVLWSSLIGQTNPCHIFL